MTIGLWSNFSILLECLKRYDFKVFFFYFIFISDTPIRYFFYQPAQDFEHFHYVYNLIRDCKSRVEKMPFNKEQKDNFMSKDVIIKIGIAGNFHEENLNLISRGTCTV